MADKQVRVMLLCSPRSTSSLFTKAMSTVPNSQVFFDSYFFCEQAEFNLRQMGKPIYYDLPDEDWLKAAEMIVGEDCSESEVDLSKVKYPNLKKALDNPRQDASFVFCKTVSSPIAKLKYDCLPDKGSNYRYSILIRHPFKVFASARKAIIDVISQIPKVAVENPKTWDEFHFMRDGPKKYYNKGLYFKELYDQWKYVKENLDPNPVIIDSDDVLSDPAHMLSKYCGALGIPYSDSMIAWDGDPKHADKWWIPLKPIYNFKFGRIVFGNAIYSKGFLKPSKLPSIDEVSFDVRESYEIVKPYYEEMYNARLRP